MAPSSIKSPQTRHGKALAWVSHLQGVIMHFPHFETLLKFFLNFLYMLLIFNCAMFCITAEHRLSHEILNFPLKTANTLCLSLTFLIPDTTFKAMAETKLTLHLLLLRRQSVEFDGSACPISGQNQIKRPVGYRRRLLACQDTLQGMQGGTFSCQKYPSTWCLIRNVLSSNQEIMLIA